MKNLLMPALAALLGTTLLATNAFGFQTTSRNAVGFEEEPSEAAENAEDAESLSENMNTDDDNDLSSCSTGGPCSGSIEDDELGAAAPMLGAGSPAGSDSEENTSDSGILGEESDLESFIDDPDSDRDGAIVDDPEGLWSTSDAGRALITGEEAPGDGDEQLTGCNGPCLVSGEDEDLGAAAPMLGAGSPSDSDSEDNYSDSGVMGDSEDLGMSDPEETNDEPDGYQEDTGTLTSEEDELGAAAPMLGAGSPAGSDSEEPDQGGTD